MALIAHRPLPAFAEMRGEGITVTTSDQPEPDLPHIRVGILNLMPDAALEATDRQFTRLVSAFADRANLWVHPFTVTGTQRGPEAQEYVARHYIGFDQIRRHGLDALIVSGANPAQPDLTLEGFWEELIDVLDWAAEHTRGVLCSCLATHAVFERYWGVRRTRLPDKKWGVYPHQVTQPGHPLLAGFENTVDIPHSHWYDLTVADVESAGAHVLIAGEDAGVGMAVSSNDFFVLLQAHPEYESVSLLKEYKREVVRFSSGESDDYPPFPANYFSDAESNLLEAHQVKVVDARRRGTNSPPFPDLVVRKRRASKWTAAGRVLYRNWLGGILDTIDVPTGSKAIGRR